ncbi:MAG: DsbA family protein [Alphaproteobacteria bacterium]|nr:DsbA family protein [Alphaproteobacteria bacterium]
MSLKSLVLSRVIGTVLSGPSQARRRAASERRRRGQGRAHQVDYFHQADDPYSCLAAQCLPAMFARYDIVLRCHLVSPPGAAAAPEAERLRSWSRLDASRLAQRAGLRFSDPGRDPEPERIARQQRALASLLDNPDPFAFIERAGSISLGLWREEGQAGETSGADPSTWIRKGDALRARLGHYLGGVFHYEGEWYWGLDRLWHLEQRLADLGCRRPQAPASLIYEQPATPEVGAAPPGQALHIYLSFRSPYTYLALARAKALADAARAELRLRFVLPMVMRGLPVPASKRRYIALDAAREARRLGIPFGRIVDPVGRPVERGYALLHWAISQGRGFEFAEAFMRGVWSEGIDAGEEAGLKRIVAASGLDWREARDHLADDAWRQTAEINRTEMLGLGLWGVPSFRVGPVFAWGQDRLWVMEEALNAGRGFEPSADADASAGSRAERPS